MSESTKTGLAAWLPSEDAPGQFFGADRSPRHARKTKPLTRWQRLRWRVGVWLEGVGLRMQS